MIDWMGCVDYMKVKCRCFYDMICVVGECEGLERGILCLGGGICGKNLELCMYVVVDDCIVLSGGFFYGVG